MYRSFALRLLCVSLFLSIWSCRTEEKPPEVVYERTANEVAIAMRAEPDGLNPITSTSNHARQVYEHIFQYLLDIDPQELKLRPVLAKSGAEIEDITAGPLKGGVAYTFEIREEAIWDDGKPVSGRDFLFSMKATLNPKIQAPRLRAFLSFIKDIQIDEDNPRRFTVSTNEKDIIGEESVAWSIPVMPEHIYDPEGLLKDIPITDFTDAGKIEKMAETDERLQTFATAFSGVKFTREVGSISGSGPYELVSWEAGQEIVLRKKKDWWGDKLSDTPGFENFPDEFKFVIIPKEETMVAALKAEEIDVLGAIGTDNFNDLKGLNFTAERYNFASPLLLAQFFLYLNMDKPELSDKRVRRALAHLTDVDDFINNYYAGFGERLSVPVFPQADYYDQSLELPTFDVELAKKLLAEAGWTDTDGNGVLDKNVNGEQIELKIPYLYNSNNERSQSLGLLLKNNAIKAGVEIEMIPEDPNTLFQRTKTGDYHMALSGKTISPTLWNPKQLWHTESIGAGGDNRTGFGNAKSDALIDEILITLDKEKRDALYKELQAVIYDEQPLILLFVPKGRIVLHKRFDAQITPINPGYVPREFKLNL